jgi:hypothetical protein
MLEYLTEQQIDKVRLSFPVGILPLTFSASFTGMGEFALQCLRKM